MHAVYWFRHTKLHLISAYVRVRTFPKYPAFTNEGQDIIARMIAPNRSKIDIVPKYIDTVLVIIRFGKVGKRYRIARKVIRGILVVGVCETDPIVET